MSRHVLGGLSAAVLSGALLLGAAACSDTTPAAAPATTPAISSTSTAPGAAEHDTADVAFAQAMIPHHAQAITMAEQASTRASSAQVKDLAARISAAQGPEIDQMNGMLATWGAPTVSPQATAMPGMSPGSAGMPGMMSPAEMQQLSTLSGPAFDRAFLQMMIGHHSGAVDMSRTELATGKNPQAKALANAIIDAQQREIAQMQAMLAQR